MNLPLFSRNNSGKCRDADKSFSELFHFQRVKKCAKACSKLGCGNGSKALEAEMKWGRRTCRRAFSSFYFAPLIGGVVTLFAPAMTVDPA
jgi:hypothetical protein